MLFFKRIHADSYLKGFIDYCKEEYRNNLLAIVIYGSYAWGYFDNQKSDYDVFVIFKNKTPKDKKVADKEFKKKFPKVSLQYYCSDDELIHKVNEGHWSVYITLLKSGRILYMTKDYKSFLKRLKKIDFIERLFDTAAMEYKAKFEIDALKKIKGYKAAKWALPSIRKRLQLLTYIRKRKAIWSIKKVIKLNRDIFTKEESKFILDLDKSVKNRDETFGKKEREVAIRILNKLNSQILTKELMNP